jgi:hypothetical protein
MNKDEARKQGTAKERKKKMQRNKGQKKRDLNDRRNE